MTIRAGFAETEITPPSGTRKIGWIRNIVCETVLDPLYAHIAVFESADDAVAFVQLDTLTVRWTTTQTIRRAVAERYGFPGETHLMVSATHNHAGPAVANCGEVQRDDGYVEQLIENVVAAFGRALDNLQEAEIGLGSCFEFDVAHNRRVLMRDGTVRTHGTFDDPNALCIEGPIDPEVAVIAARNKEGNLLGALVNFACHPAHHGGGTAISAGYPGVLADTMKRHDCPVTIFLNGAGGNIHTSRPDKGGADMPMEEAGQRFAQDALGVIEKMTWRDTIHLESRSRTVSLPYRQATQDQIDGTARGAQRFIDSAIYDREMPSLLERIEQRCVQPAEVQVHFLDEYAVIAIPAEYFVENGLRIKRDAYPRHALVVSHANGNVGYVPHKDAFLRGGYETTFFHSSRMAPETGDLLADCAIDLIREETCPG